jgi:hypothetical protein
MSGSDAVISITEADCLFLSKSFLSMLVVNVACDVSLPPMFARKENGLDS